jgi:hypothetical protein
MNVGLKEGFETGWRHQEADGFVTSLSLLAGTVILWAYVFSDALYKTWYLTTAAAVIAVGLAASLLPRRLLTQGATRAALPVFAYFAILCFSAVWAIDASETFRWIAIDSIEIVIFILFFIIGRNAPARAIGLAISTLIIPSVFLFAFEFRLEPLMPRHASYALALLPLVVTFGAFMAATSRRSWLYLLVMLVAIAVLLVGRSRAPLAAAIFAGNLSALAFACSSRDRLRKAILSVMAPLGVALLLLPFPATRILMFTTFVRIVTQVRATLASHQPEASLAKGDPSAAGPIESPASNAPSSVDTGTTSLSPARRSGSATAENVPGESLLRNATPDAGTLSRIEEAVQHTEYQRQVGRADGFSVRVPIAQATSDLLRERFPAGIGYANFPAQLTKRYGYPATLHNMYMVWLLEGGAALLLFMLCWLSWLMHSLWRGSHAGPVPAVDQQYARALLIALVVTLFQGWFHQYHQTPALWLLLGLAAAWRLKLRSFARENRALELS